MSLSIRVGLALSFEWSAEVGAALVSLAGVDTSATPNQLGSWLLLPAVVVFCGFTDEKNQFPIPVHQVLCQLQDRAGNKELKT